MVQAKRLHITLTADVANNTNMKKELYIEHITEMDEDAKRAGDRQYLEASKSDCKDCEGCPTCQPIKVEKLGNQNKEYYEDYK